MPNCSQSIFTAWRQLRLENCASTTAACTFSGATTAARQLRRDNCASTTAARQLRRDKCGATTAARHLRRDNCGCDNCGATTAAQILLHKIWVAFKNRFFICGFGRNEFSFADGHLRKTYICGLTHLRIVQPRLYNCGSTKADISLRLFTSG